MGRKRARESTMKLLYQMEINNDFSEKLINLFFENNNFNDEEKEYILDATSKIIENKETIDSHIEKNIENWELNRLAKVDLCVLRIAIYEILFRPDIPIEVSINEAIEISKKYSSSQSSKFINGVLGSIVRSNDFNEK
jgi:N utilization substance protein B